MIKFVPAGMLVAGDEEVYPRYFLDKDHFAMANFMVNVKEEGYACSCIQVYIRVEDKNNKLEGVLADEFEEDQNAQSEEHF